MRILSWKQPYAGLMLYGKIETRVWDTHYRGPVLIAASAVAYSKPALERISGKRVDNWSFQQRHEPGGALRAIGMINTLGGIIAMGDLVDVWPMRPEDEEKCMVNYVPELYCHKYENVRRVEFTPWKGKRGWTTAPQEIIDQIKII